MASPTERGGRVSWPRSGSLVLVRWRDAEGILERKAGDRDAPLDDRCEAETVGWLSKRTRANVFVASERLPKRMAQRFRGSTRIPIGWVVAVVRIAGP